MSRGGKVKKRTGPRRSCLGCRTVRPQDELIRLAFREGVVAVEPKRASAGRSGYVCASEACATKAVKQLGRAFRCPTPRMTPVELWQMIEGAAPRAKSD